MNKKSIDDISEVELLNIISTESSKFTKNATKKIFAKKLVDVSFSVLKKVDEKIDASAVSTTLENYFIDSISKNINTGLVRSLENGGFGTNIGEEIGCLVQKYVAQEAAFRTNVLRNKYGLHNVNVIRKLAIEDIVKTFESTDLQLELSESMNQEYNDLIKSTEDAIIDEAAKEVVAAIADAEKKAEVTKVVIDEFKQMSEKAQAEQDALNPEKKTSDKPEDTATDLTGSVNGESVTFNSTDFIKEQIPVTVDRFTFENEKEPFTKAKFAKILLTLEEESNNIADDREYISKRIDAIRNDSVDRKDFDVSKVDDVEKAFDEAVKDINSSFSAFRMLGFSNTDSPAFKTDKDTLDIIKKMSDLKNADGSKNINDVEVLVAKKLEPIKSAEEFLQIAFESFVLKSEDTPEGLDYEAYKKAVEVRDDLISEFIVDGMKHVPAARAQRLKEINSGLRRLATTEIDVIQPTRLKRIYYKTAKIADPGIFTDFKAEADRVKAMIADTYKTNQYDMIVDDFFSNKTIEVPLRPNAMESTNLFEIGALKAAKDLTVKSVDISTEENKTKVKNFAKVFASYMKTLETMSIINKKDILEYSRTI